MVTWLLPTYMVATILGTFLHPKNSDDEFCQDEGDIVK